MAGIICVKELPFAAIGCSLYVLLLPVPSNADLALLALMTFGALSLIFNRQPGLLIKTQNDIPVLLFLTAWGVATCFSRSAETSLLLSAPLLPSVLLYYLCSKQFARVSDLTLLCAGLTAVLFCSSASLLGFLITRPALSPEQLITSIGSVIFVVPNDAIFLALLSPFALVLCHGRHRQIVKIFALLSILSGISVAVGLQSRGATLTFIAAIAIYTWLFQKKPCTKLVLAALLLVLIVDLCMGMPMLGKFMRLSDGRFALWHAAIMMFIAEPLHGFGPHNYGVYYDFSWPERVFHAGPSLIGGIRPGRTTSTLNCLPNTGSSVLPHLSSCSPTR